MADSSPYPDPGDETSGGPGPEPTSGAPRWVKVFGVIALVLVLLVGILLLTGGGPGGHGPGRHSSGGDAGGQTPPSSATKPRDAGGHEPPAGGHQP